MRGIWRINITLILKIKQKLNNLIIQLIQNNSIYYSQLNNKDSDFQNGFLINKK